MSYNFNEFFFVKVLLFFSVISFPFNALSWKIIDENTLIIERGDNLSKISRNLYGSGRNYKKFLKLNPSLKNPDLIHPGKVLVYKQSEPPIKPTSTPLPEDTKVNFDKLINLAEKISAQIALLPQKGDLKPPEPTNNPKLGNGNVLEEIVRLGETMSEQIESLIEKKDIQFNIEKIEIHEERTELLSLGEVLGALATLLATVLAWILQKDKKTFNEVIARK